MKKQMKISIRYTGMIALCMAMLWMTVSPAQARPVSVSDNQGNQDKHELDTILVTADKRSTDLQKTPMGITVFTDQDLEDNNIRTVEDLLARVPNLVPTSDMQSGVRLSYRGAMTSVGTETSPFVMYIDGVPTDAFSALDASLLNIERVEVLRGAQSAMYGKNAFGGVINIISKTPGNTVTGTAFADAGTEYSYQLGGTVSGPVVDNTLFFSLSGSHEYRDGYLDFADDFDSNTQGKTRFKGQLRLVPADNSEITLHMGLTRLRDGAMAFLVPADDPSATETNAYGSDFRDTDILNLALHGSADFAGAALDSITTFRKDEMEASVDTGPVFFPGGSIYSTYGESSEEITQELRLQSPEEKDGMSWLVGVYGGYRDFDRDQFGIPAWNSNSPFKLETLDFAPFGQVVMPLFVDDMKLTAGLRWQYVNRKAEIRSIQGDTLVYQARPDETWREFLPKLVVSYDITDKHMIYTGVNRSFLPGGFNAQHNSPTTSYLYKPQYAVNYEAGAKTSWLDNRLKANLVLFYSEYEDMQILYWNPIGYPVATNAGEATAYGAELELDMQLLPGLTGSAAFGFTHAEFDQYAVEGQDNAGNKVPLTPDYTANLSLVYRHSSGIMAQASLLHSAEFYWKADNIDSRDSVTTVNAKLGYEGEAFDVYLYAANLFDERYFTFYEPAVPAYGFASYGLPAPPREFGLRLVCRW